MYKKNLLLKKLIITIIPIFILLIAGSNFVISDEDQQDEHNNIILNDNFSIEYDETIIEQNKNLIAPSESSIIIKNPDFHTTITPPKGTDVIDYSNDSIDLMLENLRIVNIDLSNSIKLFIPLNFISSVRSLQNYTIKICYNENFSLPDLDKYILKYSIDWGNGDFTEGNGTIPNLIQYTYKDEGNYNIFINLTDKNGMVYTYKRLQNFNLNTDKFVKLWVVDNKETVAVSSAGTIGILSLIGVALTETGKYKILSLLILSFPMFTKIQKEDVLDHFVRGEIYGYIKANPGAHYNQLMRELNIKNGTLSYHLYILEKTGIIKSRKENYKYRAFYPIDINFPEEERYRLTELQLNIIKLINEKKGINQKNISKKLNEKHQTISYNIKVLQKAGIINTNRKGRKIYCYINHNASDNIQI